MQNYVSMTPMNINETLQAVDSSGRADAKKCGILFR